MRFLAMACCLFAAVPASAETTHRLLVMEPEIDGDLSPGTHDAWSMRLELLRRHVGEGLETGGFYDIADPAKAEKSLAKHRLRRAVYRCVPCTVESAGEAGAGRTLSLVVHRVSNLVLSMEGVVRDGTTGDVIFARSLDFRGDTDEAWLHAAGKFVDRIADLPPERR